MEHKYLVSAIVSTYNSELFFEGRIKNLLAQTISNKLEIVIVNSGSNQKESEIIAKYADVYKNITYIETEVRESIYKAWNRAVNVCNGKYITNANTDDRLRNDALEIFINYLEKHPKVGLVYADQFKSSIPNEGFDEISDPVKYIKPYFRKHLFLQRCIIGSQPVWRADVHSKYKIHFNEQFEVAGDYEFEYRLLKKYYIAHISQILGVYYRSPNNTNKEFENSYNTFNETYTFMKLINREHLSMLTGNKFKLYKIYLQIIIGLPTLFYRVIYRLVKTYLPKYELNSLDYLYWKLSLLYEYENRNNNAVIINRKFLSKLNSRLLSRRLEELSAVENNDI